jgi:hypothetical protein
MSKEHTGQPHDRGHDWQGAYYRDADLITQEIANTAQLKIMRLARKRARISSPQEALTVYMNDARQAQLSKFSRFAISIANGERQDTSINLQAPSFIGTDDILLHPDFAVPEESLRKALDDGVNIGTADFLNILVPDEVYEEDRPYYFYPWSREYLIEQYDAVEDNDGSLSFRFATKHPGIDMLYYYAPGSTYPEQFIVSSATSNDIEPVLDFPSAQPDRFTVIESIYEEADSIIDGITEPTSKSLNYEETMETITAKAHEMQLLRLSDLVLKASGGEDYTIPIDVDNAMLLNDIDFDKPHYFSASKADIEEAIREGERRGTRDFLSLLVPDTVTNPTIRTIYFHPFKRRRQSSRDDAEQPITRLETRLDNMIMYIENTKDGSRPKRFLALSSA